MLVVLRFIFVVKLEVINIAGLIFRRISNSSLSNICLQEFSESERKEPTVYVLISLFCFDA